MKKILLLLALCVTMVGFCQNDEAYVDQLTSDFTSKLSDRGIDNYYTAKRYCSGKIWMEQIGREKKWCTSKGTYYEVYVVWKEDDELRLKKIDNCSLYYTLQIEDTSLFDFFDSNREALKMEEVKNYKSATYTGQPELRKTPQPCFRSFSFVDSGITYKKTYNLFDVSSEHEADNVNYEYNSQLKLIELDSRLDALLATYETSMRRQI